MAATVVARLRSLGPIGASGSRGGSPWLENPRRLRPEQKLYAQIVADTVTDLSRPKWCAIHQLALAFTLGRHGCGCIFEASSVTLDDCASALSIEPQALRNMMIGTTTTNMHEPR